MNAYIVAGTILAVWAVLVSLLGMRGFPGGLGGQRIAIAITVVLFVVAVSSAIADQNKVGERRGPEIEKPGEGPESGKPGEPSGGGEQKAPPAGASAAPKDEGEQKP